MVRQVALSKNLLDKMTFKIKNRSPAVSSIMIRPAMGQSIFLTESIRTGTIRIVIAVLKLGHKLLNLIFAKRGHSSNTAGSEKSLSTRFFSLI